MWDFFIKNSKFAYLFLVALIGVGAYTLIAIPKESSPEVIIPVGVVSTILPGAPAADVETLITNEIERGLTSLENVKKITSTSREGVSSVVVEFEADADLDSSIQDLKDTVDTLQAELPDAAEDSFVSEVNFVDQPIVTIALSADLTDSEFNILSEQVEREIESIPGVSRVDAQGVRDREVAIIVDQTALIRYELSLNQIISAVRNANLTLPIGQIINDGISYNVAFEGDITDTTQIGNVAVSNRNGQPVYVRDVAIIEDGLAPGTSLSRLSIDGHPSENSITFNVYKQSGGDITQISAAVNQRFEELKKPGEILDGVETVTVLDAGKDIYDDLIRLSTSGLQTIVLVVLLLIVAIGWREGLLAGTAIPLSFLFGFIGLYFSGNTINFLSLFSLILGIGILVDSAIVMVEGINRKMKDDVTIDKKEAALQAIREFSAPLISGTLTTVSMFVGLFIVSGVIGQFIASIPFTLIFLLFASLFVALAILPLIASVTLKRRSATKMEQMQVEYAQRVETWYKSKLAPILDSETTQQKFLALLFAGLVFFLSLPVSLFGGIVAAPLAYVLTMQFYRFKPKKWWMHIVKTLTKTIALIVIIGASFFATGIIFPTINPVEVVFFEQSDVDYIIIELENPEGTVKEVTDIGIRRVEELLYDEPEIDSFSVTVGSGNEFGSGGTGEKFANIFVNLDPNRSRTSSEIIDDLRKQTRELSDLKVTVTQPSDGPPTGAAIIVKFLGDDLSEITRLANQSAQIFRSLDGAVNVETSTNNNNTEFVLNLDRDKAASLGLDAFTISQFARTAVFGADATALTTLDEDIDVIVKLNVNNSDRVNTDNSNVTTINAIENITIQTNAGPIALSELVTVSLRESSSVIEHEEAKRVVSVTADVAVGANARAVQTEALERIQNELSIPDDVILSTGGGETDESNQAFGEMFLALIVGVALMVGILTLQFNSFLHMQYVLSILPYSLIGIMFGLAVTSNPLSFPSIMGFIALSGIVVNNSILLIDMMNQLRRNNPEMNIRSVVLEAAGNRLRPIILTTITTVIGMIPLAFAGDLWAPLAYAVMFGLVFSVIITLVLIPILYLRKPGTVAN